MNNISSIEGADASWNPAAGKHDLLQCSVDDPAYWSLVKSLYAQIFPWSEGIINSIVDSYQAIQIRMNQTGNDQVARLTYLVKAKPPCPLPFLPIMACRTPDRGHIPITTLSLTRGYEDEEADYLQHHMASNDIVVGHGYECVVLNTDIDFAAHLSKRRRVSGSMSKFEQASSLYRIERLPHIDPALRGQIDDSIASYEARFYVSDTNPVDKALLTDAPFLHMIIAGLFEVFAVRKANEIMGFVIMRDIGTHYSWVQTTMRAAHLLEYRQAKLGAFIINSMWLEAKERGLPFDMGFRMDYKDLWKPDAVASSKGLEWVT